jgi:hypothetical protein
MVLSVERAHSVEYREPYKINVCMEYREVSKARLWREHSFEYGQMGKFYLFAGNAELLVVSTAHKSVMQFLHRIASANDAWSSADAVEFSRIYSSLMWNLKICFLHAGAGSKHGWNKCNLCLMSVGLFATTYNPTVRSGIAWLLFIRKTVFRTLHVMFYFCLPNDSS